MPGIDPNRGFLKYLSTWNRSIVQFSWSSSWFFFFTSHKVELSGKKNLSWESDYIRLPVDSFSLCVGGEFYWLIINVWEPSLLLKVPPLVRGPGLCKKVAEKAMESKPVSSTTPWFPFQFLPLVCCLWVLAIISLSDGLWLENCKRK